MHTYIHTVFSEDFDQQDLTVIFQSGDGNETERQTSQGVSIIADMALEGTHSFTVNLYSPLNTGYTIGSRDVLTVIILDTTDCKKDFYTN